MILETYKVNIKEYACCLKEFIVDILNKFCNKINDCLKICTCEYVNLILKKSAD